MRASFSNTLAVVPSATRNTVCAGRLGLRANYTSFIVCHETRRPRAGGPTRVSLSSCIPEARFGRLVQQFGGLYRRLKNTGSNGWSSSTNITTCRRQQGSCSSTRPGSQRWSCNRRPGRVCTKWGPKHATTSNGRRYGKAEGQPQSVHATIQRRRRMGARLWGSGQFFVIPFRLQGLSRGPA